MVLWVLGTLMHSLQTSLCFHSSANFSEQDKVDRLEKQKAHLTEANEARDYYRTCQKMAKEKNVTHLSFDFAQQVQHILV